jgi:Uma2 family endonuclease
MDTLAYPRTASLRNGQYLALDGDDTFYPETDGLPMADNTLQYEWIVTFKGGLDALFADRDDVFVAGNLFWYPVKGNNKIVTAPDAMVVIGRPKGYRSSYRQWLEEDIPPQVVVEILSPGNTVAEMMGKLRWYEEYGVQEYYLYDPDRNTCTGWIRNGMILQKIAQMNGWKSPLLEIIFQVTDKTLAVMRPDGKSFEAYMDVIHRANAAEARAEAAQRQAKVAKQQAEAAQRQTKVAKQQAEAAQRQAKLLADKLRELGINPDSL